MTRKPSAGSGTADAEAGSGSPARGSAENRSAGSVDGRDVGRLPLVVIVGRPNVGKSTLFNRLVGRRQAIVQDTPGVTRDRITGEVEWGRSRFQVVDTGGLDPISPSATLTGKIRSQIDRAVQEADLFLLIVDGQVSTLPKDLEIARELRRKEKPIVCAVNKIDPGSREGSVYPYYGLGFEPLFPISAEHGLGLPEMLDHLADLLPATSAASPAGLTLQRPARIAVVGRPNVGKSTLVNTLLGEERQIVDAEPGTTRDAVDTALSRWGEDFILIDTAGIRRRGRVTAAVEKFSVVKALESLARCDVALLLLDASSGVTDQDAHIGGYILEKGRGIVVLLNKWDLTGLRGSRAQSYLRGVRERLGHLRFAPILPVSASTGYNVDKALRQASRVRASLYAEVPTGPLNRLLEEAVKAHPPPSEGPRPTRFFYMTQIKKAPPTFLIFTNSSKEVHFSYQRYLVHRLRERFGFEGVPIRLQFRKRPAKAGAGKRAVAARRTGSG